jgi:hypothetical protein
MVSTVRMLFDRRRNELALTVGIVLLLAPSVLAASPVASAARQAPAQCQPSWIPTFGAQPGVDGEITAMTVFDDGSGPALYVCGAFNYAGGVYAPRIAKWDGSDWSALGPGVLGSPFGTTANVSAMTTFDDGSGEALYVGGYFMSVAGIAAKYVAKWNGSTWSALGSGMDGAVLSLAVFDDGQGAQLYAGGGFSNAGGGAAYRIARWNGSNWSPLPGISGTVYSLAVFDDGTGPALCAGTATGISKWYGSFWGSLGSTNDRVSALTVYNDNGATALCAGGRFTSLGGVATNHVATRSGVGWSSMSSGINGAVNALTEFNDGHGRALYAGGQFATAGGTAAKGVAKWTGTAWSALGSGIAGTVNALVSFNPGSGRELYVGGFFAMAGGNTAMSIAKWNGSAWSSLGRGFDSNVSTLAVFDDGTGPALFAGGWFTSVGGVTGSHVAKWSGADWSGLGSGIGGANESLVLALCAFDDGGGSALYAGGTFISAGGVTANHIAKWDGSSWSALGSGVTGTTQPSVYALAVFDDGSGPALYAGGYFATAGGVSANHIAKWNGSAWSALGTGLGGSVDSLAVFDDGTGSALYAAGTFTTAGGGSAKNIAKWNGTSWSGLGNTMTGFYFNPVVESLTTFDDGGGLALYVAGIFDSVGGVAANNIAKWNGSTWSALGLGITGLGAPAAVTQVQALTVFDDGTGPKLFAKGDFTRAGMVAAGSIAKWDGSAWSPLGQGLNWDSLTYGGALAVFDDSSGPALFVGGGFRSALDSHDSYLAKWGCPFVSSGANYCSASTTTNGCVPTITSAGSASASSGSGFTISVGGLESHKLGLIFYGIHGPLASTWGASTLCVKAPTQRMHAYDSGGSPGLCNGLISEDWNLFLATHTTALGQPFAGGETVWAQGWFRDPPSAKTTALSNGLVFSVAP